MGTASNRNNIPKLIWIDAQVNNDENNEYKSEIKEKYNKFNIISLKDVDSGIKELKELSFQEVFVIVSGRLYKDFIKNFMNNLPKIKAIPKIIIFTGDRKKFLESNNDLEMKNILNNKYFNLGGIQVDFAVVFNFLSTNSWKIRPKFEELDLDGEKSNELTFEYIDSLETLMLPRFYRAIIRMNENDNFDELNQYLYNKYSNTKEMKDLLSQIEGIPSIPHEILCKYYAKLYTMESNLYEDLNKSLRKKSLTGMPSPKIKKFVLPYVKLLYEGLKLNCFSLKWKKKLYRFSCMSKEEKNILEDYLKKKKEGLPAAICFSRAFLSFSENRDVANFFLKKHLLESSGNDELLNIIFILQKNDNFSNESLTTFINLSDIAVYEYEKEVLFLPFSAFEIKNIKKVEQNQITLYEIELNYLDEYTDKLKLIENNEFISNTLFGKECTDLGLIEKSNIEKKTNKKLIDDYNHFDKSFIENKQKIINNKYSEQITKNLNKELIYDVKKKTLMKMEKCKY